MIAVGTSKLIQRMGHGWLNVEQLRFLYTFTKPTGGDGIQSQWGERILLQV